MASQRTVRRRFRRRDFLFTFWLIVSGGFMVACVNAPPVPLTCAVLIREDGKHRTLTPAEHQQLEMKLRLFLQRYGLALVSDVSTADRIVTGVYEADHASPFVRDFVIHSITANKSFHEDPFGRRDYSMLDASEEASTTTPRPLGHPYRED